PPCTYRRPPSSLPRPSYTVLPPSRRPLRLFGISPSGAGEVLLPVRCVHQSRFQFSNRHPRLRRGWRRPPRTRRSTVLRRGLALAPASSRGVWPPAKLHLHRFPLSALRSSTFCFSPRGNPRRYNISASKTINPIFPGHTWECGTRLIGYP